ncbi:MAG TPA: apolipoprotein N-acyltransferase [Pyrinomonadaceae bacterium]|nr:apolipoprotein N-acyltransferase [Pyrinomonadaceae bacterium]
MQQVVSSSGVIPQSRWFRVTSLARLEAPSRYEWFLTALSTGFLILSFPNYESYLLAWIGLVPLLLAIARRPSPARSFILGWAFGTVFFYVTCYWLTHSMIHYGGIPTVLAYVLLIPGALVIGIFPGLFAALLALAISRWGERAVLLAPVFWVTFEWVRLGVTGQLWNALGYSQAFNPLLIQAATWGGVYAVSFLIVAFNSAITLFLLKRSLARFIAVFLITVSVLTLMMVSALSPLRPILAGDDTPIRVIALQPNVPMTLVKSVDEQNALLERHLSTGPEAKRWPYDLPKLVVWPESPMNFTYGADKSLQELLATFTRENGTSLLFNSLEAAPGGGAYNSALLINEEGRLISQYDKIRLMPFGEYVPLPQWLPGASLISGIVGDFTPGSSYTLMPVGDRRIGTFICIEAAYPSIARNLVREGADGLINISNDGYLGPTAVMRQHLANAVFRAVENRTSILRVTNTGLSARISSIGFIEDQTQGFQPSVKMWIWPYWKEESTFYTRHGDVFVQVCAAISLAVIAILLVSWRRSIRP